MASTLSKLVAAVALLSSVAALSVPAASAAEGDPLERVNRGVFWFNETLDVYVLEPVAKGWDFVLPDRVQQSIGDFFSNLRTPVDLTNQLLQGKPKDAGLTLTRFVLNTTVGVGGLFDAATNIGLEEQHEDFGQTLGTWGAPSGPYIVLPFLGPSNLRDSGGFVVDSVLRIWPYYISDIAATGTGGVRLLNGRADIIEELAASRATALDFYVFVRDAYGQHRARLIQDLPELPEEEQADLYYFDDEDL